ncbi:hypothetical protein M8C21_020781 [Ambrosia artemisiifolia]|uniref:Uncharacterized protein n=1 Tax=Ambrosia artemisiifolia TaxID=4212 RepID=A0AAD5GLP3_AMBAR|nr:hypothetical protein M8C21_020781 [Ambrosia artemisiifolia]
MESYRIPTDRFAAGGFRYRPKYEWPIRKPSQLRLCPAASITNGNNKVQNRMFILGMGYVGEFVAQDLMNQGWVVSGTCTSPAKKEKLKKLGLDVHLFDANHPELEVINVMNQHTHLLVSIPPCKDIGDPMLQHGELLKSKLNSVYGDCGGAWVDEIYQPKPSSELAKLRLAAEEGWLNLGVGLGLAAHVFRLGGIYGPGRSAIDTIMKPDPLSNVQRARSSKKFTSRVHVADISNALNACIHRPHPGIYNIVDDDPASRIQVFSYAHELINEKWPSRIKKMVIDESRIEKGNLRGEKRVVNARMKKELGVRLIHPSYKTGLQSICEESPSDP